MAYKTVGGQMTLPLSIPLELARNKEAVAAYAAICVYICEYIYMYMCVLEMASNKEAVAACAAMCVYV